VQQHLSDALTGAPPGPIRLVSLCAGQAHDVLGVLPRHPRRDDVTAVLVELDPRNALLAADRVARAGLAGVSLREADAGVVAGYAGALPADVLLLCGIFGNISEDDISRTIAAAPVMCAPGGTVIWTRHRRPPDRTPRLRELFEAAGFSELAFDAPDEAPLISVGVHRLRDGARQHGLTQLTSQRLFTFGTAADRPVAGAGG
jgi:hypothetical protein